MLSRIFFISGSLLARQSVSDQHRRQIAADLGRMDAAGDQDDRLALSLRSAFSRLRRVPAGMPAFRIVRGSASLALICLYFSRFFRFSGAEIVA